MGALLDKACRSIYEPQTPSAALDQLAARTGRAGHRAESDQVSPTGGDDTTRGSAAAAAVTVASNHAGTVTVRRSGLYAVPALLNHSCVPNTTAFHVGDFMFVVATVRIPKGAEVTLNYRPALDVHICAGGEERDDVAGYGNQQEHGDTGTPFSGWDFACECALCRAHAHHAGAYRVAARALRAARASLGGARDAVAALRALRGPLMVRVGGVAAWPHLATALFLSAEQLCREGMLADAAGAIEQGLELCPVDSPCAYAVLPLPPFSNVFHLLAMLYSRLGNRREALEAGGRGARFARRMYGDAATSLAAVVEVLRCQ
eukprot:jgi/Mesvir1/24248/Mv10952-RA.1